MADALQAQLGVLADEPQGDGPTKLGQTVLLVTSGPGRNLDEGSRRDNKSNRQLAYHQYPSPREVHPSRSGGLAVQMDNAQRILDCQIS
jgi:hypothetical protein